MMIKKTEFRNLYDIMKLVIIGNVMNWVAWTVPFIVYYGKNKPYMFANRIREVKYGLVAYVIILTLIWTWLFNYIVYCKLFTGVI